MTTNEYLADPTLAMCADIVDDLEKIRIANENRLRTLTATDDTGHGLTLDHPDVKRLAQLVTNLQQTEHQAVLNLNRVMRHHPLAPWMKARPGIGEKQFARLLAVIGDPFWNDLHNRPRKLRELYAYCGYSVTDGTAPTRRRGEKTNWNTTARTRLWLIADKCIQITSSPYRVTYDNARTRYTDSIHTSPCVRCGPAGKPAPPGSPLSLGHQHARARRLIAKHILRDLFEESQRLHQNTYVPGVAA